MYQSYFLPLKRSPRFFATVTALANSRGINLICYLDDWLNMDLGGAPLAHFPASVGLSSCGRVSPVQRMVGAVSSLEMVSTYGLIDRDD